MTWEKLFGSGTGSGDDQCLGWSDQCLLMQAFEGVVEFAVHAHYSSHCSSHVDFTCLSVARFGALRVKKKYICRYNRRHVYRYTPTYTYANTVHTR